MAPVGPHSNPERSPILNHNGCPDFTDGAGWLQWLDGFGAAHSDYPDEEAIEGMLEDDFSRGKTFEAALERVAGPEMFGRIQGHLGRFITGNTDH